MPSGGGPTSENSKFDPRIKSGGRLLRMGQEWRPNFFESEEQPHVKEVNAAPGGIPYMVGYGRLAKLEIQPYRILRITA